MTTGEDGRRGVAGGDLVTAASPVQGAARPRVPFLPVTEPVAPTDHVDTDEIPIVGARAAAAPTVDAAHPFGEDDDADPMVPTDADEGDQDVPAGVGADALAHRPRPVGLVVTVAMLTVLLLAAAALIAYLWRVSEAWEARTAEITAANYEIGSQLAATRDTLTTVEDQLDLVSQQLATSKDTVTRLQAENAQWGDDAAFAQEEIAALETTIATAGTVANSLSRCIEGHEQLAEYLTNPDDIKPKELLTFRSSVDDLCKAATEANLVFQRSVSP